MLVVQTAPSPGRARFERCFLPANSSHPSVRVFQAWHWAGPREARHCKPTSLLTILRPGLRSPIQQTSLKCAPCPAEGPSGDGLALGADKARQARNEGAPEPWAETALLSAGPDQGAVTSRENVQFGLFARRRVLTPVGGCLTETGSAQGKGTDAASPLRIAAGFKEGAGSAR